MSSHQHSSFHITSSQLHLNWSKSLTPVMTVPSGSEITFDLRDGGNLQIRPDNAATSLSDFDFSQADPAQGPIYIDTAEPGDVLKIEFLDLVPGSYGWTAIFPGFGLLSDEFPDPVLKIWDLSPSKKTATFKSGIEVPVRPFLGIVGVAPAVEGELSTIPPYAKSGGNMDCRDLSRKGSTLYLPVNVPGALFSCGDGHAAQGDGEVCGTAIETTMKVRLRLTVEKRSLRQERGYAIQCPHFVTPPPTKEDVEARMAAESKGEYAVLGIHEDMREATRMAVRGMIDWLEAEKGLTRVEAYMLASVGAGLKFAEVVDMPNFGVVCSMPLSVFVE
ncbi:hypothetical protein B0H66DRAFT_267508 [Apodospora peruviana]|uniref:Formamidase n=1 Tax=Apodospora peruviana TaxID=516989 RepID=A0AAE0M656_9PEZI|nr:hypothetical protein B0H66DRAFT_267508 [Apodospora peruviana]